MRIPSPMPAQTGATWLCNEQQTTGMPASPRTSFSVSSACGTACWSDVYGSFMTWAPGSASKSSPRVRFVEQVEAARAELEVAGLDVDDHLVALFNRSVSLG